MILLSLITAGLGSHPRPVYGKNGMVVSTSRHASQVGIDILKNGGNAVDAAVAVGFALAVTSSSNGNIGGGGFMVARFADGKPLRWITGKWHRPKPTGICTLTKKEIP